MIELIYGLFYSVALQMIRSLELMASFHRMCECDTWEEVTKVTGKSRVEVESIVSELELVLGKRLIHRRPEGDVVSSFSGKFFMPTDAGMKWYLLIGGVLRSMGGYSEDLSSLDKVVGVLFSNLRYWERRSADPELLMSTVVVLSFNGLTDMENLRIYTSDFLSYCFLETILTKLVSENKVKNFEVLGSEPEHLCDFDAYFLAYEIHVKDFQHEMLHESRIGLYASSDYLERVGEPKKLEDLSNHKIIRCKDTHVVQALGVKKFGTVKEYVPLFYKKRCVEVESANSCVKLGETGLGLIAMTDMLYQKVKPKLLRIAPLDGEEEFVYRRYTLGYHQKYSSDPLIKRLSIELKDALLN